MSRNTNTLLTNTTTGPIFNAYMSSTQSISAVTMTTLLFGASDINVTSGFNTSTSIFTAPLSGYYNFSASIQVPNSATTHLNLFKNAGLLQKKSGTPNTGSLPATFVLQLNAFLLLNAGDTIYLSVQSSSVQTFAASSYTNFFQGYYIHS
jgi:hypothetical protein